MSRADGSLETPTGTTPTLDRVTAPTRGTSLIVRLLVSLRALADSLSAPRAGITAIEPGTFRRVLTLWAAGRAVSLGLLWGYYEVSRAAKWGFGPDGFRVQSFLDFLTGWDADRYGQIAMSGYPVSLPTNLAGDILPNNWAFLPVFPFLTRLISGTTGLPWQFASIGLATVSSLVATWLLYVLMRRVTKAETAWWVTVFFSFAPLSFILSLGYSEGLFLSLTFGALLLAIDRRYTWLAVLGATSAFTRPGALALALTLGIVFVVRWFRRDVDPFTTREMAGLGAGAVVTGIAGLTWPVIADWVTGIPHAYVRTETGWWLDSVGAGAFVPFSPWFRQAATHLGIVGVVLVLALMAGFVLLIRSKSVQRMGLVVVAYGVSYGLYLFAVFLPQQSLFRLIMPLTPLMAHDMFTRTPRRRFIVVTVLVAVQAVAVGVIWTLNNP